MAPFRLAFQPNENFARLPAANDSERVLRRTGTIDSMPRPEVSLRRWRPPPNGALSTGVVESGLHHALKRQAQPACKT